MAEEKVSAPLVLDCTLRDGGYYNSWDFRPALVETYFRAVEDARVDIVELGFRLPPATEYLGPFAYTTDAYLSGLDLPKGPTLGVMLNASDLVDAPVEAVDGLFDRAERSPIDLVRIAAHFHQVDASREAVTRLRELGYRVGFNLMQTSTKPVDEVRATAERIRSWDLVEVLYFADSLGDMTGADVRALVAVLRDVWDLDLGIHTHDNRSRALDNTLAGFDAGVRWIDATILGMGRGAGNCRTDFLLFELAQQGHPYRAEALLSVTEKDFRALQADFGWGTNLLYFKSAANSIHPTYVQFMQADDRYNLAEMSGVLDALPHVGAASFSSQNIELAVRSHATDGDGRWSADGWLEDRDVLILGGGPSLQHHGDALAGFIERDRPAVLCLNTSTSFSADLIDAYVACHPSRILLEGARLAALDKPLLAPARLLDLLGTDPPGSVLDYGITIADRSFDVRSSGCTLPARLALAYALAAATAGGARRILFAGMDGYPAGDSRQEELVELFALYDDVAGSVPLLALTPTTYPVPQGSVYAPYI